jgi:putative transposase
MPRYARLHYPGGLFHIISRCLNHEFLINSDEDRRKYLSLLQSALSRCDATLLAWCLMSGHVHLVVRAGDDPLDKLMKPLHSGYAGWKNRRAGRVGPVFAGRFKSPLVDADTYLLELVRYVHNNPVRARQAPRAALSPWSSHRAYVGMEPAPPWLNMGEVLGMFSSDPKRARQRFAAFVDE